MIGRRPGYLACMTLVAAGALVLLVGLVSRGLEQEYGSGLNFSMEFLPSGSLGLEPDSPTRVYEAGSREAVFEGTFKDAIAYTNQQRRENTDLLVPNLIIASGVLVGGVGLIGTAANVRGFVSHRR
jgi:hypothetical protein